MANQPVQVVTNPQQLRGPRTSNRPNKAGTDFYEGDNDGFGRHRDSLVASLESIQQTLSGPEWIREFGGSSYIKVTMAARAIAKSHRPQKKVFTSKWTPHVSTAGIGEPIYAVTAVSLRQVISIVQSIPLDVPVRLNRFTGNLESNPSRARCEVSAIGSIELWTAADRRDFSVVEATEWLDRSDTGRGYLVNFFPMTSAANDPSLAIAQRANLRSLELALRDLSVEAQGRSQLGRGTGAMVSIGFLEPGETSRLELGIASDPIGTRVSAAGRVVASESRHESLLMALERSPLVRDIALPPVPVRGVPAIAAESVLLAPPLAAREGGSFARVGVVDGGVSDVLDEWIDDRWGQLASDDRDEAHGTFIGGLLAFAGSMNPSYLADLPAGCALVDVDVLPADPGGTGVAFGRYYPNGVIDFMDEVESAVADIRSRLGVRVFNFSLNFVAPGDSSRYGYAARRLDQIARNNDVIFVVSAGNLVPGEQRSEWPADAALALATIVGDGNTLLNEPAESLFNLSVSALNPPGLHDSVPYALARYSRRGPGLRGATKPDLAHVGGSGTADPTLGHGLHSIDVNGNPSTGAGTSYSAPLVARNLADLDHLIEDDVPREVLLALMVHYAEAPQMLRAKALLPAARDLVGFGVPASAEQMLDRPDSEIVLVVHSTVFPKEEHILTFSWPEALVNGGKCRGYARLTLVARPVLAYEHGDERVRVNIDAKLMQQQQNGGFTSALSGVNQPRSRKVPQAERELLIEASKWQVVKSFDQSFRGRGESSTWKLLVEYLTRAEEDLPDAGVEFAAVLTIADDRGEAPIFQQMRQHLGDLGVRTGDIRTSIPTRVRT